MKTIVISGPSGSGKTLLTKKLSEAFEGSIVINTDSYYRDNKLFKFLSIFIYDLYDRILSLKKYELKKTLLSIYNKEELIEVSNYDFKRKKSSKSIIRINYGGENQFLILEGIFSHRLGLNYDDTLNIVCKEEKEICFERRIKRDKLERGRDVSEVSKRFHKSWYLFYLNVKNYIKKNKVMQVNPGDNISYNKLFLELQYLKKIT